MRRGYELLADGDVSQPVENEMIYPNFKMRIVRPLSEREELQVCVILINGRVMMKVTGKSKAEKIVSGLNATKWNKKPFKVMKFFSGNQIIVCDLDGTMSDHRHRAHHAEAKRWDEYYAGIAFDPPRLDTLAVLTSLAKLNTSFTPLVLFLTGRPRSYRGVTYDWLERHLPDVYPLDIVMRWDGDRRPGVIVKPKLLREWLASHGLSTDNVLCAIDDHTPMCRAWREMGIPAWDVGALPPLEADQADRAD